MAGFGFILSVSFSFVVLSIGEAALPTRRIPDFDMQVVEMSSIRVRRGYLYCTCSPTSHSPSPESKAFIEDELKQIRKSGSPTSLANSALDECIQKFQLENCINAVAALRETSAKKPLDYASSPSAPELCTYDRKTGRNLAEDPRLQTAYVTVGSCNEHRDMASRTPISLAPSSERLKIGSMECDCSPTSALPPLGALKEMNVTVGHPSFAVSMMKACIPVFGRQSCADADRAYRTSRSSALCTYDTGSGRNMKRESNVYVPVGICSQTSANLAARSSKADARSKASANWHTEGCVAIEHLRGYSLQHRWHLRRHVLCRNGFCATPNHGIVVRGVYTSMKRLCNSNWTCTRDVRLVNNLRWIVNERVVVNDEITILPFDYRFPWYAVVLIQFLHDALWLSLISSAIAFFLAVLSLVLIAIQKG